MGSPLLLAGFFVFTRKVFMGDLNTDVSDNVSSPVVGSPAPTGEAASSAERQEGGSGSQSPVVGDVNAGLDAANNSGQALEQGGSTLPPPTDDPLKGVPTVDELRAQAEQKVPYAQALLQIREAYEASTQKVNEFEPLSAFKPIVEKTTPEQLQAKLEIIDGFFAPALDENQQPILDPVTNLPMTTALPGLQKLAEQSPDTIYTLLNDALQLTIDGQPLEEQVTNFLLVKQGLNPANITQYAEWEKTGAPVATSGVDYSLIPEPYIQAFKSLPPKIQADIASLMGSESPQDKEAGQYYLDREKREFDRTQAEVKQREQQAKEFQSRVEASGQEFVDTIFKEEYDSTLQSIASQWQSSSDPNRDALQQHMIMNTLVNLTDPRMSFSAEQWLKSLNIQPDPKITELALSVESKAKQAKAAEVYGDSFKANQLRDELRNDRLQLKAKVNGIATSMVRALSGQLVLNQELGDELLEGAAARPLINGTSVNGNGKRQLADPDNPASRTNYLDIARRTGLLAED